MASTAEAASMSSLGTKRLRPVLSLVIAAWFRWKKLNSSGREKNSGKISKAM
jgi:hypothetical protein